MRNIPKTIIHFWHDKNCIPQLLQTCIDETSRSNNDYTFILADDSTILNILAENDNYDLMDLYKLNKIPASRADIARLILLYVYGGFYLDVKFEMIKSLNELVELNDEIILVQRDDFPQYKNCPSDAHVINGITGIAPKSDFIASCLKKLRNNLNYHFYNNVVWHATGAGVINDVLLIIGGSYKVRKLSWVTLNREFFHIKIVPEISNSWVYLQKDGIIDKSHYVRGILER